MQVLKQVESTAVIQLEIQCHARKLISRTLHGSCYYPIKFQSVRGYGKMNTMLQLKSTYGFQ